MQSLAPVNSRARPHPDNRLNPVNKPTRPRGATGSRGLTMGTALLALYLFVVHSYKLPLGTAAIVGGLFVVGLTVRPLRACPPIYFYAAFLLWTLVTLPAAINVADAWLAWVELFKIFLIGCLAFNAIRTPAQHRFITLAWLGMFALYPVRGTLFNFAGGNATAGRYGWNFAFSNFNDMAALTLMPLAMSFERLRSFDKRWIKLCALAGVLSLPFVILITQSRAGMLGLATMFLYLFAGTKHKLRLGSSVVGIALVAVLFAPQGVWDRIRGMQYLTSVETLGQADASAEQRYVIWQVARSIIYNNPVIGVGIGNYPSAHGAYAPQKAEWTFARGNRDAHSTYLRVTAETGLIGLALYIMVFVSTFTDLQKKIKSVDIQNRPDRKVLRERFRTYQGALLGLAVCAIFGSLEAMVFPFFGAMLMAASTRFDGESLPAAARRARRKEPLPAITTVVNVR